MPTPLLKILPLLALFLAASPSMGAPGLGEAIQSAMQRHPDARRAQIERDLGAGYRRRAEGWLGGDPSGSLMYKSDRIGSGYGYREMEAALTLPLWLPGQRASRQRLAAAIDGQADSSDRLLRWQVAGEVLELMWRVHLVQSDEELADAQWDSAIALEKAVQRRVAAGELARADLLMVQQDTLGREVEHENAQLALDAALADWKAFTGLDEVPALPDPRPPRKGGFDPDHPLLQRQRLLVAQNVARRDLARRQRQSQPELILYARRDRGVLGDPFDNAVGAEISLPFGLKSSTAPQVAESEAGLARARMALAGAERDLTLRRVRLEQELSRTRRARELAQRQSELADRRRDMTQRAFDLGESDVFLLLQARSQAARAARNLIRTRIEYLRAVSRYNHLLGEIPQ